MLKFAIFDVDLTLTRRDTFIEFYKFLCKQDKRFCFYAHKVIYSGIMYAIKIYDEKKSKEQYLSFLKGLSADVVDVFSEKFYKECILDKLMYVDGLKELKKRKEEGYVVILISASPEFYLNNFNSLDYVDYVIGTKYELQNGYYTGRMIGSNNKGYEKVVRLYEFMSDNNMKNVNFKESFMYSDSLNDLPLLELVGNKFLINSRKKIFNIKNLFWN